MFRIINLISWICVILLLEGSQRIGAPLPKDPSIIELSPGNVKGRETEVDDVLYEGEENDLCYLHPEVIKSVCKACAEIYSRVYRNHIHTLLPAKETGTCEPRLVDFGFEELIKVYVRKCPANPTFYISKGNKPQWLFVHVPSKKYREVLNFQVHLGPFRKLPASY